MPELKNVDDPLNLDERISMEVLLQISTDQEHFKRVGVNLEICGI